MTVVKRDVVTTCFYSLQTRASELLAGEVFA